MALAPCAAVSTGLDENEHSTKSIDRWAGPRCAVGAAAALVIGTRILFSESPEARALAQIGGIGSIESLRLISSLLRYVREPGPPSRTPESRSVDLFKDSAVGRGLAPLGVWASQAGGWMESSSIPLWGLATLGGCTIHQALMSAAAQKSGEGFRAVHNPIDSGLAALGLSLTLITLGMAVDPENAVSGPFQSPHHARWWLRGLILNVGLLLTFRERTPVHESVGLALIGFSGFFKVSMLSSLQMGLNDGFLFLWAYWFLESLQGHPNEEGKPTVPSANVRPTPLKPANSDPDIALDQNSADKPTKS